MIVSSLMETEEPMTPYIFGPMDDEPINSSDESMSSSNVVKNEDILRANIYWKKYSLIKLKR